MSERPIDAGAGSVPVVRPVVVAGARSAELAPSIDTYGGDETRGVRTVQHWQLRFGDLFVADTASPEQMAVWQAVIDERASLLAEVERLSASRDEFARTAIANNLALAAAAAERDSLRGVVQAVRELHQKIPQGRMHSGFCNGCEFMYPCPTARVLAAAADAPQPAKRCRVPGCCDNEDGQR